MNIGIAVHTYSAMEGTGGYVTEVLPRIAAAHQVTLYAARVVAPVPHGVTVVHVPAVTQTAYTTILSYPLAFRFVRRRHDILHAQGWITGSADVVTAHIVLAAWREAALRAGVRPPIGERLLGGFVEQREATLFRAGAHHLIAPSEKVRREIAQYYGRTHSVSLVYHGFPRPVTEGDRTSARRQLRLPEQATIALVVGDPRKALDVSLQAVAAVPELHLAVASHSRPVKAWREAQATGLCERTHWLGSLPNMAPAYAAADMLLHPTIYDSFGLVVAEAMAHGLPVIVTSAAGISELITHQESGWVVDPGSLAAIIAALQELGRNPALRRRLGEGGRTAAGQRSWNAVARETLTVYEQVAE